MLMSLHFSLSPAKIRSSSNIWTTIRLELLNASHRPRWPWYSHNKIKLINHWITQGAPPARSSPSVTPMTSPTSRPGGTCSRATTSSPSTWCLARSCWARYYMFCWEQSCKWPRSFTLQAYKSLVENYGWKSFTLLYQDNHGLMRLQELITSTTKADVKIVMKRLNFKNNDENK